MAHRYRADSLKPIKRMIAAGQYEEAKEHLLARRASLVKALEHPDCNEAKVELVLTCVNSLLAECCSLAGWISEAEEWFEHTFLYCKESHDPLVRVRLHRVLAMHYNRVERYADALEEINEVIDTLSQRRFYRTSSIPEDRIEIELAYSISCKAEILLTCYPGCVEGIELARLAQPVLRHGSKRRYELQNLLLCIDATNRITSFVLWQRQMLRANYLNARYVHSVDIQVRLMNAATRIPVASTTRSLMRTFNH